MDYGHIDPQDIAIEKHLLAGWREQEVQVDVRLLTDRHARGKIKAVTERAIIVEDDKGRSVLCPWSAIETIEEHRPGRAYGHSG